MPAAREGQERARQIRRRRKELLPRSNEGLRQSLRAMLDGATLAALPVREGPVAMPLFYIDTSDEDLFVRDDDGMEFVDVEAAKDAAIAALPQMASDKLPSGDARSFVAIIRGAEGATLLRASLTLEVAFATRTPTLTAG